MVEIKDKNESQKCSNEEENQETIFKNKVLKIRKKLIQTILLDIINITLIRKTLVRETDWPLMHSEKLKIKTKLEYKLKFQKHKTIKCDEQ